MPISKIYQLIKEYLMDIISRNKDGVNFLLPSEQQLSIRFKCSRLPAKRALNELVEAGLVTRYAGRGSYITSTLKNTSSTYKPKHICVIIPHINSKYINEIVNGISEYFHKTNTLFFCYISNDNINKENFFLDTYLSKIFDGIIFFPAIHEIYNEQILHMIDKKFPLVFLGRKFNDLKSSFVGCSSEVVVKIAIEHLIQVGYKKIGLVSEPCFENDNYSLRINTYKRMMAELGSSERILTLTPTNTLSVHERKSISIENSKKFHDFLENNELDALIMSNAFLNCINKCDIFFSKINSDSFISIDRPEFVTDMPFDKHLYIHQDSYTMGQLAAEQILELVNRNCSSKEIIITPKLKYIHKSEFYLS